MRNLIGLSAVGAVLALPYAAPAADRPIGGSRAAMTAAPLEGSSTPPASGLPTEAVDAPKRSPVHVGFMIGLISLPRPLDAELYVRLIDLFAVGVSYSDFPAFVADPLLSAAGAKSGSTTARLDDFSAFDVELRVMPFRGAFFLGAALGRQKLKGAVTESTTTGAQTATVDLRTTYATPRIGWLWTLGPGFLLGFDFGVQLKIGGTVNVTVPPTASQKVKDDAQNLADLGSSYPLPSLHLRIGWIF